MGEVKLTAVNIKWDTDGDKQLFEELPKEIVIPLDVLEDAVSDYLSDTTGFCHDGYSLSVEVIDDEN